MKDYTDEYMRQLAAEARTRWEADPDPLKAAAHEYTVIYVKLVEAREKLYGGSVPEYPETGERIHGMEAQNTTIPPPSPARGAIVGGTTDADTPGNDTGQSERFSVNVEV